MLIDTFLIYFSLVLVGLCMGSFAGASVWRLRARQLIEDKSEGEKVDAKEYKQLLPLTKTNFKTDRSRCLHCGHELAWYDLLPLVSWVSVLGKCRYCGVKIGKFEPVIELGTALFFVLSYILWPDPLSGAVQVGIFVLWLASGVMLAMLFAYDFKWFLLPNRIVFSLMITGGIIAALDLFMSLNILQSLISLISGAAILSGLYFLLWYISKGQWIGFGDVKLGLALALLLSDWRLAFIALFAANVLGCMIVIPGLLLGKMTGKAHVPFGPLLIVGTVFAMLLGHSIINWYVNILI